MLSLDQLTDIIARGEQLDVEFKSDRRTMPDREIYEEVVSLANSKGGVLLIGVEDDGTITGAHPRHGDVTDPPKLQSACVRPPLVCNGKHGGNSYQGDHKDTPLQNPQTTDIPALEAEIDRLVYALYGLTEEEIAVVEGKA